MQKNRTKRSKIKPDTLIYVRVCFSVVAMALWIFLCFILWGKENQNWDKDLLIVVNSLQWISVGFICLLLIGAFITFFLNDDQFDNLKVKEAIEDENQFKDDIIDI